MLIDSEIEILLSKCEDLLPIGSYKRYAYGYLIDYLECPRTNSLEEERLIELCINILEELLHENMFKLG